jgi:hypothetical protein
MFPASATVTVVAVFVRPDGRPESGWVYFEPTVNPVLYEDATIVGNVSRAELGEDGTMRAVLLDPTASGVEPSGWHYKVTQAFLGCATESYTVSIPSGTPTDTRLNLGTLPRVV